VLTPPSPTPLMFCGDLRNVMPAAAFGQRIGFAPSHEL
jgi:hypothetical protein